MNSSSNNRPGFFGAYFDRDVALRLARWAGILAWVLLGIHVYTTFVSLGQFWYMVATGAASYAGVNIFDRLSIPTLQLSQLMPGIVYFIELKVAQQVLLILMDVEDNTRRAAKK